MVLTGFNWLMWGPRYKQETRCRVSYKAGNLLLSRGIITLSTGLTLHAVSKKIHFSDLES